MDLDEILPIENFSDLTIQLLSERLQRSRTAEHCIYRETELDELWRLLDIAIKEGDPDGLRDSDQLRHMRTLVHEAHDLVGMENKPQEAATVLRSILVDRPPHRQ